MTHRAHRRGRGPHALLVLGVTALTAAPPSLGLAGPRAKAPAAAQVARANHARLRASATRALSSNVVRVGQRQLLAAGGHQFGSLWTRDFAFAARGLLAIGDHRTVRDQLDTIFEFTSPDGLVPRGLDTIPIPLRVVIGTVRHRLGLRPAKPERRGRLRAQLLDEHESPALDGGLLVALVAMDYVEASGDEAWWTTHEAQLASVLRHYEPYADADGLLVQPRYSDWQDSVRREGKSFYLNLLRVVVARRLGARGLGMPRDELARLEERLHETFFDARSGLYRSLADGDYLSLDGNLLAIDLGFVDPESHQGRALYQAMKRSPLWTRGGAPGSSTVGDYPKSWAHLPARLAGLRHYHDRMHWSWLIALSAKVAARMGDHAESSRIFDQLDDMVERDGTVVEIYQESREGLLPFKSLLYKSEAPFSWGAGMVLDALDASPRPRPDERALRSAQPRR